MIVKTLKDNELSGVLDAVIVELHNRICRLNTQNTEAASMAHVLGELIAEARALSQPLEEDFSAPSKTLVFMVQEQLRDDEVERMRDRVAMQLPPHLRDILILDGGMTMSEFQASEDD